LEVTGRIPPCRNHTAAIIHLVAKHGKSSPRGERHGYILFTDIYRSTSLWEQFPQEFKAMLERHNTVVENGVAAYGGEIMKNLGDGYIAVFESADECVASGVEIQKEISALPSLANGKTMLLRVVAHAGSLHPLATGRGYFGRPLNRVSRICQICHPGQMLISDAVRVFVDELPAGCALLDMGEHRLRDLAEMERLYQIDHPEFALHDFPPLPTLGHHPNNLAVQPNEFIGRVRELRELKDMLVSGRHRVTTITAPGGYGKSRLATQLCADTLDSYKHGAFVVPLAPVGDHTRIISAAAAALGFQFYGRGDPKQQLLDYLREKQMLLLLDNFEHVIEGKSLLAEILRQAPGVSILVTSREPLRLQGEKIYRLEPLLVGDGEKGREDDLSDAVALFVDRATLVKHDFRISAENLDSVEEICHRLEGVPLSIELAAAWMDAFTLPELLSEVEHQLELTARMDDIPERHRSIRASLDWSYGLLNDEQREVLRALATFKGGFFLEAANSVIPKRSLRRILTELSDKGWLFTREIKAKTRFFIRDAASREYAFQKLHESEDWERAILAHSRLFASLLENEAERLQGRGQSQALEVLSLEIENIYEALDTALNRRSAKLISRYAKDLVSYVDVASRWQEGLDWYEHIAKIVEELDNRTLTLHCLLGSGRLLWRVGRYEEAERLLRQAKDIAEEDGEQKLKATALNNLGVVSWRLGSIEQSDDFLSESLRLCREVGDTYGIVSCLNNLGVCAMVQQRYEDAEKLLQESLDADRDIGNMHRVALTLSNIGLLMHYQGFYEKAKTSLTESRRICHETGYQYGIALSANNLGVVAHASGDYEAAEKHYLEGLQTNRDIGNNYGLAASLVNLGVISIRKGRLADATEQLVDALKLGKKLEGTQPSIEPLIASGSLLLAAGKNESAAVLFAGVRWQVEQAATSLGRLEQDDLTEGWAKAEETVAADKLEELKSRAEKMSLDELMDFALEALSEMKA